MRTAQAGRAGALVQPGQHHGRAKVCAFACLQHHQHGQGRARSHQAVGDRNWAVPAAHQSVYIDWRAASSKYLEQELTSARSRSENHAEVKAEHRVVLVHSLQRTLEHTAAQAWSPSPSRNTSAPWTPPPYPASSGYALVSTSKVSAGCPLPQRSAPRLCHLPLALRDETWISVISSDDGHVGGEMQSEISKCFCWISGAPKKVGRHSGILPTVPTPMCKIPSGLVRFLALGHTDF